MSNEALVPPCDLMHLRCTACGCAIHNNGGCGCEDNRHHRFAELRRDEITRLRGEVERLQRFLRERLIDLKTYQGSGGGYHLRRVALEADHLLRDPEYFPGQPKEDLHAPP